MSFLSPLLLFGALAVAVPLALHFFYKVRYHKLPWAAMRFLKLSIEQTSRRLRFQEYVLLALRCLALLLLALALARPTWNAISGSGRGESIDAVLLIDTSYSMGASDGELTRLDRAKAAALSVIDNLPNNSTVQVYACADRASFLGPRTPSNLDQARQVVNGIALTSLAGDVLPGLVEAEAALDRSAGTTKEVYLFGDLQKSGWEPQAAAIRARAAELKRRGTFVVVRCGSPARSLTNVAVTDLTYPGGIPHTNSRVPVSVVVKNTGAAVATNLTVTLEVEGQGGDKETGTIEELAPGQSVPVTLTAKLDRAGLQLLTATVQADDLPGDNRLDRLIAVRDAVRVLVVDGAPNIGDPKQSASHFVTNALLPVSADQQSEYHVRVTVVAPEEAGAGLLGANDVCILCNVAASNADRPGVPGLSAEFVARLPQFVREGGGLIVGAGDNVSVAGYNQAFAAAANPLLPFALTEVVAAPPDKPLKPAPDSTASPSFLSRFKDEPFSTVTVAVDVEKCFGVNESSPGGGRVLMRLANQQPWLTQRTLGDGEVLFVGTSLDASWTNWPGKAGSYLSLLQLTMAHLVGKTAADFNRTAGDKLSWSPPDATRSYDLLKPGGSRVKVGVPSGLAGDKLALTTTDTPTAGLYRYAFEGEEPAGQGLFAVSPDLRESENLEVLSDAEATELLGFRPVLILAGPDSAAELTTERGKREWTVWVLLGLFAVAVGESLWAWFCGKAW